MIVEPVEGKTVVYWGTPQVKATVEATAWPQGDRERSERQANSCKRLIAHGALNPNDGRKKSVAPDRQWQRQKAQLDQALAAAQPRVDKQAEALTGPQAKVPESAVNGHGKRLEQHQRPCAVLDQARPDAQHQHARRAEHASALGPLGKRADRDFRQQTIMSMRTLLLENALRALMVVRLGAQQTPGSLECIVRLLFERSGARRGTSSAVVYWITTAGVSLPYQRLLAEGVEGLGAMDLRAQGKPLRVRLRDMPP